MEKIIQNYPAPKVKKILITSDKYSPDFILDLHGHSRDQATKKLFWILENQEYKQWKKIRIITGKGTGILYTHVLQFCKKHHWNHISLANESGYDVMY